jgi:hypothetical protein
MNIPAGSAHYISPPAKPVAREVSAAIAAGLSQITEIMEAHLPMMYAKGYVGPPAQVLIVVVGKSVPKLQSRVIDVLRASLPPDSHMDVMEWGFDDPNLHTVRNTCTQLNLSRRPN